MVFNVQTERPKPTAQSLETDLAKEIGEQIPVVKEECGLPPSMSVEDFKKKYPEVQVTVTINMGQPVVCQVAGGKVFVTAASTFRLVGSKPLFLYAGGSWISDSNKAKDFLTKPGNEGKGVEFRLESAQDLVTWLRF